MIQQNLRVVLGLGLLLALTGTVFGQSAPRLALNPVAGVLEAVDTAGDPGLVRHTVEFPDGHREVSFVSAGLAVDPRLAIDDLGDSWVVWWNDEAAGRVSISKRSLPTGTWTQEVELGDSGADSRSPAIVHRDGVIWVAHGAWAAPTITIVVEGVIDNPEPIPTFTPVAEITAAGEIDLSLHSDHGYLWMTWVEDSTQVCWSEYDEVNESWSVRACQSLNGNSTSVVRASIRDTITQQ